MSLSSGFNSFLWKFNCQSYCFFFESNEHVFLPQASKIFLFPFGSFQQVYYDIPGNGFLYIYLTLISQYLLSLWFDVVYQFKQILSHHVFKYHPCLILSMFSPSRMPVTLTLEFSLCPISLYVLYPPFYCLPSIFLK